jgi:hypothetical protein
MFRALFHAAVEKVPPDFKAGTAQALAINGPFIL